MSDQHTTIKSDDDCSVRFSSPLRRGGDLDMTSMVDVTFLLLIFFMVTASFSIQRSIPMPPQVSDKATSASTEDTPDVAPVFLEIDRFGSFLVRTDAWEKSTVGKQNLTGLLRDAISDPAGTHASPGNGVIDVAVDSQAKLQSTIDGIDASTAAGFATIEVHQTELQDDQN